MAVTIDGTNGITSPDFEPSSSTTPTNGLFLPATNALGFATNSTECLRLDASGNLGLGVTPSGWSSSYKVIQFGSTGSIYSPGGTTTVNENSYYNGTSNLYLTNNYATRYAQTNGQHRWFTAPSGTAGATISFTQAMTLDASGNLGIGTSSPGSKLQVNGTSTFYGSGGASVQWGDTSNLGALSFDGSGNPLIRANTGLPLIFQTNGANERARIDSSGNLLVGTTTTSPGGIVASKSTVAGTQCFGAWNAVDAGNAYLFYGGTGSASFTARYQIYWNFTSGTGTAGFISDYRQKDNVRKLANGLDAIKALKPSVYRFKDAQEDASGFIAHEVQEVIPQAVSGHKDEVDEDGNPKYQMLDQTHIIPYLTAAIQELTQRLEALENK